jgi:hypothetical protein
MKRTTFLGLFILIFSICNAQFREQRQDYGYRQHNGFYLSMSLGPVFPSISDKLAGNYDYVYTGTGAQFDLKLGGAIQENLILHATLTSNSLVGPTVKSDGQSMKASNNVTLSESMIGVGLTYYVMPSNIFLSGSLGLGNFSTQDTNNNNNISSDRGFAMQLKVGREWWVSSRWGLGFAITYGKTTVNNKIDAGGIEKMDSNNIGIVFNASLH